VDCPGFTGDNPIEWVRKCNSFFELHQVPMNLRTQLATMQFHDSASEWYDGYLIDHEPPDWIELVKLVTNRFKRVNSRNTLEELKGLNQAGSVEEYWNQFEKLRSRMLLEGRQFSTKDFIDAFISGLKGEIKPFVMIFKPETLDNALDYALHMESATESQFRKLKNATKIQTNYNPFNTKSDTEKIRHYAS
jgi:Ty3 transposon capsid-like protein